LESRFWCKQNCLDNVAVEFEYNLATMTRVKVCGITTLDDARLAAQYGADAVGLVFAESPRKVSVEEAREIAAALPDGILKVGVFVDAEPAEVLRLAARVELDYAQLHGNESPEVVATVRNRGLKVMKAFRVQGAASLEAMRHYEADLFLLDAYSERVQGGTGERFDWVLAKSLKGHGNIVISGGLTPENVREAIRFFEPYGVDASSSLEDGPGKKSAERVRRFISAAKG
jgi:phosphoribosylanthranilate isomerase